MLRADVGTPPLGKTSPRRRLSRLTHTENSRAQCSHTVATPAPGSVNTKTAEFAERGRSSPCQVRRDITSFCHPRRFAKGAGTLTGILAGVFAFLLARIKGRDLGFRGILRPSCADVSDTRMDLKSESWDRRDETRFVAYARKIFQSFLLD